MLRITALAARPFLASPPPDEEDGEELSLDGFILPPCIAVSLSRFLHILNNCRLVAVYSGGPESVERKASLVLYL